MAKFPWAAGIPLRHSATSVALDQCAVANAAKVIGEDIFRASISGHPTGATRHRLADQSFYDLAKTKRLL